MASLRSSSTTMPKEQAMHYVDQLRDFYTAGWLKLIGQ